jgi:hypothetical protein
LNINKKIKWMPFITLMIYEQIEMQTMKGVIAEKRKCPTELQLLGMKAPLTSCRPAFHCECFSSAHSEGSGGVIGGKLCFL